MVIVVRHYYPNKETHPDTAIVVANSFNGSVTRGFGRKAQAIADITGMPVLAYDRTGTGNRYVFSLGLRRLLAPSCAVQNASRAGEIICRELDSSTKSVVLYGHSAAGPEAAALARSQRLPALALALSDPVGVRKVGIVRGAIAGIWYNVHREWPAEREEPSGHNGSQLRFLRYKKCGRALLEAYNYSALWASDFTMSAVREIAEEQPETSVFATFASESISGGQSFMQGIVDRINSMRPGPAGLPVEATIWPSTLHSSFENPNIASEVVMTALQQARPERDAA